MEACCPYCMTPAAPGAPCPGCGRDPGDYRPASHHFPPGSLLHDRYLVGRVLGEGGFGITYLGLDTRLKLPVAVKEYFPTVFVTRETSLSLEVTCHTARSREAYEKGRDKFLQEARMMARLDGVPHIVRVLDHFPENNTAYIVMEFLEGETLKDLCARQGPLPAGELLPLLRPVLQAMEAMHAAGIIHRDISPDNLMRMRDGSITLMDFGCARELEGRQTQTVTLKHGFAPREQYTGRGQGPWTDLYALSATVYYCLTGKIPPWSTERDDSEQDPLIPPRQLGADLTARQEAALLKGLAVHAKNRWQSAAQFADALYREDGDDGGEEPAPPPAPEEETEEVPSPKGPRFKKKTAAAVAACLAVLIGGTAVLGGLLGGRDAAVPDSSDPPQEQQEEQRAPGADGTPEEDAPEEEGELVGIILPDSQPTDGGDALSGQEPEQEPEETAPPREEDPAPPKETPSQTTPSQTTPSQPEPAVPTLEELEAQAENHAVNGQYLKAAEVYRQMNALGYITQKKLAGLLCDLAFDAMLDDELAIEAQLYQEAMALGSQEAKLSLASCYQYGVGVPKSEETAFRMYLELAQANYENPIVFKRVAEAYAEGIGTARNPEQAIYWWNRYLDDSYLKDSEREKIQGIIAALEEEL